MTNLSLSEWASIAEVIGAIGVVISLIFVGVQVRENTDEIRATNRHQLIGRAHSATTSIAANQGIAAVIAKLAAGAELTPAEQVQFGYYVRSMIYDVQEAFLLRQEERLDEGYWLTRSALFGMSMSQDAARSAYERDKKAGLLHKDFVHWAEGVLES